MTRLILTRHGRSEANLTHVFAGHTDAPLSPLGKEQAELLARRLYETEKIDVIYASDLSRTVETARPTAERFGLPIKTDPALREIFAGAWENLTFDELMQKYRVDRERWTLDLPNARCTGGESVREVAVRMECALRRIAEENEGKTVLISTHWTPLYCAFSFATGTPLEKIRTLPQPTNCSITIIHYENGKFTPVVINDDAHIPSYS